MSAATTKAKKARKAVSHPPAMEMIKAAIVANAERKGTSLATIKKYIDANFKVNMVRLAPHLRRAIVHGVESGYLVRVGAKGAGASGSFRLAEKAADKKKASKAKAKAEKKAKTEKKAKADKASPAKPAKKVAEAAVAKKPPAPVEQKAKKPAAPAKTKKAAPKASPKAAKPKTPTKQPVSKPKTPVKKTKAAKSGAKKCAKA